jgi:hypothetical protein
MASQTTSRPPLPPFTHDSAMQNVRLAEDGWNTRDPAKVALAYTIDSRWRNRSEFIKGRSEVIAFLSPSGPKNSTTDSSRKCGHSRETALPCASLTSGTTTQVTGIAPVEMKTGSSTTTPADQLSLDQQDNDIGTSALTLLPAQAGTIPHLLVTTDKSGTAYLLNRDRMGDFTSRTTAHCGASASASPSMPASRSPRIGSTNNQHRSVPDNLKSNTHGQSSANALDQARRTSASSNPSPCSQQRIADHVPKVVPRHESSISPASTWSRVLS